VSWILGSRYHDAIKFFEEAVEQAGWEKETLRSVLVENTSPQSARYKIRALATWYEWGIKGKLSVNDVVLDTRPEVGLEALLRSLEIAVLKPNRISEMVHACSTFYSTFLRIKDIGQSSVVKAAL
jgi:hypothetical protein